MDLGAGDVPEHEEALEELGLHRVQAQIHLRDGPDEDEQRGQREAGHGEPEGAEQPDDAIKDVVRGSTNFTNAVFSRTTSASSPVSL